MPRTIHGTRLDPARQHPVLDLAHWEAAFPLNANSTLGKWIDSPGELAQAEQARRAAAARGNLGPSVPVDLFVWALGGDSERPWLTRLGGVPWREADRPWPRGKEGVPLHFLGQICFADSTDILPFPLPGEVALIFGRWQSGWVTDDDGFTLEWSSLRLKDPHRIAAGGWTTELPFCYQGVIHRSAQYTDSDACQPVYAAAGLRSGWGIQSVQATSVAAYAQLPQGWPFEKGDGNALIATLSSFYFRGRWPVCNVPRSLSLVRADGTEYEPPGSVADGLDFGLGDAGCMWIYRDRKGGFHVDWACG